MIKLTDLRCEYQVSPMGIDENQPRLSWILKSDERNVEQSKYSVVCSYSSDLVDPIWGTGWVVGNAQTNVVYAGDVLKARSKVYWQVSVLVNDVEVTSDISSFEMGMLDSGWVGKWISPNERVEPRKAGMVLKDIIDIDAGIKSARLYISALGVYSAYINGDRVGADYLTPGWTVYNSWVRYQTYDITDMLKQGENVLSAQLGCGWYSGPLKWDTETCIYGDTPAIIAQVVVETNGGEELVFGSDENWQSRRGNIVSSELYDGEVLDATLCDGIDGYDTDVLKPCKLFVPKEGMELVGQNCPPIRCIDELQPVDIITTPKGETVLDFGQNIVGWVRIALNGKQGDRVKLLFGEVLEKGNFYNTNMRSAKAEDTFILDDGMNVLEPHFTFHGFRYVKLDEFPTIPICDMFTGRVLTSDMEYRSDFTCSDEKINRLYKNVIWGQKGNFVDLPTDCPQRDERLGWTGDTQVFASTASYNSIAPNFYEKWLKDLAIDQLDDGAVPHVVPDVLSATDGSAAWGDAAVIVPYTMYEFYKDTKVLELQYDSMKAWVEYIRKSGDNEYLWDTGFHYGDWLAQDGYGIDITFGGTPKAIVCSAMYYYSTTLFAKIAGILGKTEDENEYKQLAENIKTAFGDEFITKGGRLSGETQTAYTLALHFGLSDKDDVLIGHLVDLVRRQEHRITTGFVGTPYILHVLTEHGYVEDAYKMLLNEECPGWLYQVNNGATTIWERWDGIMADGELFDPGMNSYNHYAYGAIAQWMYSTILGIKPIEKGFSKFEISPIPMFLENAKGNVYTLWGDIQVGWQLNEKFILDIVIPANTSAVVCLPNARVEDAIGYDCTAVGNDVKIELSSGQYSFEYDWR